MESTELETKYLGKQVVSATELDLIPWSGGDIEITFHCSEFTSFCPKTGQPDFATLKIQYNPGTHIAETKSVKLVLQNYRDRRQFNELLVTEIKSNFVDQLKPKWLKVTGIFHARGGISVEAASEYFVSQDGK